MSEQARRSLEQAAEALRTGDLSAAEAAASEARERAEGRPEPLEVMLVIRLAQGTMPGAREVLEEIAALDPRNPVGVAFRGLDALRRGEHAEALGYLSWFVGTGSLPARGASIPLPTAPGEIEEQAALCALALRAGEAALQCIAQAERSASGAPAADPSWWSAAQRQLVRADALVLAADAAAAEQLLAALIADPALPLGIRALAELRLDALAFRPTASRDMREERPASDLSGDPEAVVRRLKHALALGHPDGAAPVAAGAVSDILLWRVASAVPRLGPDAAERLAAYCRMLASTAGEQGARLEAIAACTDPRPLATTEATEVLRAVRDDTLAFRLTGRLLAGRDLATTAMAMCALVGGDPSMLDRCADALLFVERPAEAVFASLRDGCPVPAAESLRSRMIGRMGLPEEALATALAALRRDPAVGALHAAVALAAAEIGDETLLLEIDEIARGAGCSACGAVHDAWRRIGEPRRAEALLAFDPSIVCVPPARESAEADALLKDAETLRPPRLTVSDACLLLVDAIAPDRGALELLVARVNSPEPPFALPVALATLERAFPARPDVRRLARGRGLAVVAAESGSPMARCDEILAMDAPAREAARAMVLAARPRTPEAIAALVESRVALEEYASAAVLLEEAARVDAPIVSFRGMRDLLRAAAKLVRADRDAGARAARALPGIASRDAFLTVSELCAAMRIAAIAGIPESELRAMAGDFASRIDALGDAELPATWTGLRSIVLLDASDDLGAGAAPADGTASGGVLEGDPWPAAVVAEALAREHRVAAAVRARLARTAIALLAVSGGSSARVESLLRDLHGEGIDPFLAPSAGAAASRRGIAASLLRASDAAHLLGDEAGSEALLQAALTEDPALPSALNNLAFRDIERCRITAETVRMAEAAATAEPDNPAILDTLGLLRIRQGRTRDSSDGPGAITLLRQALRLNPESPSLEALDHLGDALWLAGDQQGAVRCWKQVDQLAVLRYPPEQIARSLMAAQEAEFGLLLIAPTDHVRRTYGQVVERASRKVQDVARGLAPDIGGCGGEQPVSE